MQHRIGHQSALAGVGGSLKRTAKQAIRELERNLIPKSSWSESLESPQSRRGFKH
jgi:hypothetical protein